MEKELFKSLKKIKTMVTVAEPVQDANDVGRITSGMLVKGDIKSSGDLRIDGEIEGTVRSATRIVIGAGAKIKGAVICESLDFWGDIDGDIYVRNKLSVKAGAKINGGIHVGRFEVEIGAVFNGSCKMITEEDYDNLSI